jgi:hypothetical protein
MMDMPTRTTRPHASALAQACIDACTHCTQVLRAHAGDAPRPTFDAARWQSMLDCAEACESTVRVLRGDPLVVPHIADACAQLCDGCSDELAGIADDPSLAACVDAARRCARACLALAASRVPVLIMQSVLRI